jgi:hypothetical protein
MSEKLTQKQIVRAVTNDPALSEDTVALGDTEIKIVDLDYDDYCKFVAHLQPLLELLTHTLSKAAGLDSEAPYAGLG